MLTRRRFLALSGAGITLATVPAWASEVFTTGGPAFGSYWRLSLSNDVQAREISARFGDIIEDMDRLFSPYRRDSALSMFNRHNGTDWMPVAKPFSDLLARSLAFARRCDGAFDPTVGPSVARQGFGPIRGVEGRFEELKARDGAVRKQRPELTADLCGIAKGHALDLMTASLETMGVSDYLLDLGGEVAVRGHHPDGRSWQVGIDAPCGTGLAHVVALSGKVVATSGNTLQGFELGGREFGHIVDPATGRAADGDLVSVSVLGDNAALADAWATALTVKGAQAGPVLAERAGVDAMFLVRDGEGLRSVTTGLFADHLLG